MSAIIVREDIVRPRLALVTVQMAEQVRGRHGHCNLLSCTLAKKLLDLVGQMPLFRDW